MSKLSYELVCREKGCNGYNKTFPEITPCNSKKEATKKYNELKNNPLFEAVYIQVNNGDEIID